MMKSLGNVIDVLKEQLENFVSIGTAYTKVAEALGISREQVVDTYHYHQYITNIGYKNLIDKQLKQYGKKFMFDEALLKLSVVPEGD